MTDAGWITAAWDPLGAALQSGTAPWQILLLLAASTLLLEDLAIAAGAALAAVGSISWEAAFIAVAGGIALGDLGLYALGRAAGKVPWLYRRYIAGRAPELRGRLESRLWQAVLLARVVPGLRLVTYTVCGFARVGLTKFSAAVLVAVAAWTGGLMWLGDAAGAHIAQKLGVSAPLAVALPVVAIALVFPLFRWFRQRFFS
jgi:membrane protein DedA with SNARE-associated domain